MELHVTSVDYAPEELHDQVPLVFELLREIPGSDRPDYWIGRCKTPIQRLNKTGIFVSFMRIRSDKSRAMFVCASLQMIWTKQDRHVCVLHTC